MKYKQYRQRKSRLNYMSDMVQKTDNDDITKAVNTFKNEINKCGTKSANEMVAALAIFLVEKT